MFLVHDEFPDNAKWEALYGKPELWGRCNAVWLVAGCYAKRAKTNGRVSRARLLRLTPYTDADVLEAAEELVRIRLWERDGSGAETGYSFHDWADVQETKDEADERRSRNRLSKRAYRARIRAALEAEAARPSKRPRTVRGRSEDRAKTARGQDADSPLDVREESSRNPRGGLGGKDGAAGKDLKDQEKKIPAEQEGIDPGDLARATQRAFLESPLTNIATLFDVSAWREDWAWIGARPLGERAVAMRTLASDPWARRNWRRCTPRHIRKWWASYAAGESPVFNGHDGASAGRGGRGTTPSEVGRPEDFNPEESDV